MVWSPLFLSIVIMLWSSIVRIKTFFFAIIERRCFHTLVKYIVVSLATRVMMVAFSRTLMKYNVNVDFCFFGRTRFPLLILLYFVIFYVNYQIVWIVCTCCIKNIVQAIPGRAPVCAMTGAFRCTPIDRFVMPSMILLYDYVISSIWRCINCIL